MAALKYSRGKFGPKSIVTGLLSDIMEIPRPGEETIDMHNRMTEEFNKTHKIEPGDKKITLLEAEEKQGGGWGQAIIE